MTLKTELAPLKDDPAGNPTLAWLLTSAEGLCQAAGVGTRLDSGGTPSCSSREAVVGNCKGNCKEEGHPGRGELPAAPAVPWSPPRPHPGRWKSPRGLSQVLSHPGSRWGRTAPAQGTWDIL